MSDLPRSRACSAVAATLVCCLVLPVNTWAVDNLVFPSGTGMVDVVRDRGVDNTGRTDVTAKLNQILTTDRAIYLPIGTYRVSGMLRGPHHPTFAAGGESAGKPVERREALQLGRPKGDALRSAFDQHPIPIRRGGEPLCPHHYAPQLGFDRALQRARAL